MTTVTTEIDGQQWRIVADKTDLSLQIWIDDIECPKLQGRDVFTFLRQLTLLTQPYTLATGETLGELFELEKALLPEED